MKLKYLSRIYSKRKDWIFVTLALIFMQIIVVYAVPKKTYGERMIEFGAIENIPPYSYMENEEIKGIDYQIYLEIVKRSGMKTNLRLYPFKRILEHLQNGKLDVALQLYYNPDRENFIVYSNPPARWSSHYIFVRADRLSEFSGFDIKALYGKRVGKDMGYFISSEFMDGAKNNMFIVDEAMNTTANIQKLFLGRIDCYVSAYHFAMATINMLGLKGKIIHLSNPIIPKKGIYLAVSKKALNIDDKELFIKKINEILQSMHDDGTIAGIENPYTY